MNRDDIIRMAREAGYGDAMADLHAFALERFAALVADHEREILRRDGWQKCAVGQSTTQFYAMTKKAVKAEREACERLVWDTPEPDDEYVSHREAIAAAIRARGKA